jgi:hypothetical protein
MTMLLDRKRVRGVYFNLPTSHRKHNLPSVGVIEFTNGFGTRWDCHLCSRGVMVDGDPCIVCGLPPDDL